MLQSIHDNAKGWVAYLIVGLISVPFALWGIQEYLGGGDTRVVAEVNGEEIDLRAVQNAVSQQRQRLVSMFGGKMPPGFDDSSLKQSALSSLVDQELLKQYADKNGYRASAKEVLAFISTMPAFQNDGKFDPETYRQVMSAQGQNAASYEEQLRQYLSQEQFTVAMNETAFLPASEIALYQRLEGQTRDVELYTLKVADKLASISVDEAKISEYYEKNIGQFQTEEKVKVSYVELDEAVIAKSIELTEDDVVAYYEENSDRYFEPEKFQVNLIKVNLTESQDKTQAENKANEIHAKINAGELSFESAVSSLADESLFYESGEGLGLIPKGTLNADIDVAVSEAAKGDVLAPIFTGAAFEIVQVVNKQVARNKAFAEVKAEAEKNLRKERSSKQYEEQYETLRTIAYENDGSLQPVASALNAEIQTTDWFTARSGEGIAQSREVIQAAFSPDVLEQGRNSSVLDISGSKAVVVRLEANEKPQPKSLTEVQADIETRLKQDEANALVKAEGDALYAKVKESADWSALGDAINSVQTVAGIGRADSTKVDSAILQPLFKMTAPAEGKSSYESVIAPSGDFFIIALKAVNDGKPMADNVENQVQQYVSYEANREEKVVMDALRADADIKTYPERLIEE
ncbi:MAG: Peptidyl-prolyl cis-trans isomerase PpiD (EC [uncultured Thiotrichaceae bacterium]|uniref:Periplasmic chaperone PpiD n=1 Tax=uncultured Thiotrichaceae bacterium TaxID=298394 RepID=A0A6S6UJ38_9GAMM|nr:MAG: Peptidyl-prolyl cis-trans isomerase PpiD (EC [uncultured Thiotrichaceae bacterium]